MSTTDTETTTQQPVIHVWYSPEWQSWGITYYDHEGNPEGESEWYAYKSQALESAPRVAKAKAEEHNLTTTPEVRAFTKGFTSWRIV